MPSTGRDMAPLADMPLTWIIPSLFIISYAFPLTPANAFLKHENADDTGLAGSAMVAPSIHPVVNIATMFACNYTSSTCKEAFLDALNNANQTRADSSNVHANIVSLPPQSSVNVSLNYVCDAVFYENISLFVVVGTQDLINLQRVVTDFTGIPLLGYATDKEKNTFKSDVALYTELQPTGALLAEAMVRVLLDSHWNQVCLILQNNYAADSFTLAFQRLTDNSNLHVEYFLNLYIRDAALNLHYKLLKLKEQQCRIFVLHSSGALARRIFDVIKQDNLLYDPHVWLLTGSVYTNSFTYLKRYPIGAIAFKISTSRDMGTMVRTVGKNVRLILDQVQESQPSILDMMNRRKSCDQPPSNDSLAVARLFDGYIKKATWDFYHRPPTTNSTDSISAQTTVKLLNLISTAGGKVKWKNVGNYKSGRLKTNVIIWPGDTLSGPIVTGQRTLRVVTNIAPPFVMEHDSFNGTCATSVPCLRVSTKNKTQLDDVFDDYARKRHGNYDVRCCQGLSINVLQSIANDLNFHIQLYITADEKYGDRSNKNATWNGLVEDLQMGLAHMAVAPFSITRTRSSGIDFTHPYFYSGFSLLVSERKRKTPIYAFMEPFDGWVWISIVVSATVVAVVLSIFEWRSPFGLNPWGRKRKTNYTLGSGLNMVYAILFGHTVKTKSPKAWPSKWLQNFWAGASIFIYSSYTANLAAFLAGKNSGVTVSGIHDPRLLEHGKQVGIIRGSAVEEYVRQVNQPLYARATRYSSTMPIEKAIVMLTSGDINAYLDDTPILAYAQETMDVKCQLRMVNNGFADDAYGIGLPKGSWLKDSLDKMLIRYHDNGYIEELKDRYFRHSHCKTRIKLQGEAERMNLYQHAGQYMLLVVGIFMCVTLMFLEHATFKWLVPYWRRKPKDSFWKSLSMMFWSQRLHRIITSEELVSPHHSAREMIEVVKNRDFTKLFQKSVKKQEKMVRNRKNLFSVVEQLQWQQLKEELLSKQSSVNDDYSESIDKAPQSTSIDSDNAPCFHANSTPSRTRHVNNRRHIDYLLARNLDSLLLKSLEENNILQSGDSTKETHSCGDSTDDNDDVMCISNAAHLTSPADIQIETDIDQNDGREETDERGSLLVHKRSPLLHSSNVDLGLDGEASCERRYSSVDIPGISIQSSCDDGSVSTEYSLLPNGMVIRTQPSRKPLKYCASEYRGMKARMLQSRTRCRSRDSFSNNLLPYQYNAGNGNDNKSANSRENEAFDSRSSSVRRHSVTKEMLNGECDIKELDEEENGAVQSTIVLSGAVPSGAVQSAAVLSGAVQSDAVPSGAVQSDTMQSGAVQNRAVQETESETNCNLPERNVVANFGHASKEQSEKSKAAKGAQKFSKEELYLMWKVSESELKKRLESALKRNEELQEKLSQIESENR